MQVYLSRQHQLSIRRDTAWKWIYGAVFTNTSYGSRPDCAKFVNMLEAQSHWPSSCLRREDVLIAISSSVESWEKSWTSARSTTPNSGLRVLLPWRVMNWLTHYNYQNVICIFFLFLFAFYRVCVSWRARACI